MELRLIEIDDSNDIWNWRNDPHTRDMSRHQQFIEWGEHEQWFSRAIQDPKKVFYFSEEEGKKVGVVRFDKLENGVYEVNIMVNPSYRNLGFGRVLLNEACNKLKREGYVERVIATIREKNLSSLSIFKHCGFEEEVDDENIDYLRMVKIYTD